MYMWTSGSFPSIVSVATCTRCCVDAGRQRWLCCGGADVWGLSFPERLEVEWGSSRCMDACSSCVEGCGHPQRWEVSTDALLFCFFLPSWNSSLNMMHMNSIIVETRSSRETIRDVQVVWKTLISLVAGSRLGFVTLTPSWLAVDRSLSCLRLCDPPSAFCSQNSF